MLFRSREAEETAEGNGEAAGIDAFERGKRQRHEDEGDGGEEREPGEEEHQREEALERDRGARNGVGEDDLERAVVFAAADEAGAAHTPVPFSPADATPIERRQHILHMIQAHKELIHVDSANAVRFENVLKYLGQELDQTAANAPKE